MMNKEWKDATRQADLERVRTLLSQGGDINAKDEHGQTALMNAAHAGQLELVRLLIEHDANLNVTAKYNLSALMLALIARHTEISWLLIEAGADLTMRSSWGSGEQTALTLAEAGGHHELAALLRHKGAAE